MKIAYVGQLLEGGTCRMRLRALQDLGYEVTSLDSWPAWAARGWRALMSRVAAKLGYFPDFVGLNKGLRRMVESEKPDILWIDKGLTVTRETIEYAKTKCDGMVAISYHPDHIALRHNRPPAYRNAIPVYDAHVATRQPNVGDLVAFGAKNVIYGVPSWGYDPQIHRPMMITSDISRRFGGRVGFIGGFELDRATQMLSIAANGIPIRVWGWGNWRPWSNKHADMRVESRPLWGEDYARAICAFDINLCFLRKINRDQHTSRSVEIPACGGFMLGERTDEHLALFEEGKEAEFFGCPKELIEKIKFYLAHDDLRKRIALAGRERCLKAGYDYPSRMRWMLDEIFRSRLV